MFLYYVYMKYMAENENKITAFWAIKLSQPVADQIAQCMTRAMNEVSVKHDLEKFRICSPENYHITLMHMGSRDRDQVKTICEGAEKLKHAPVDITLREINAFYY